MNHNIYIFVYYYIKVVVDMKIRNMRMEYVELLLEALNKSHKCEICGKEDEYLEISHIKPISEGGLNKLSNIKFVCRKCGKNSHGLQFERGNKASYIKAYMKWYFSTHPEQHKKHIKRCTEYSKKHR